MLFAWIPIAHRLRGIIRLLRRLCQITKQKQCSDESDVLCLRENSPRTEEDAASQAVGPSSPGIVGKSEFYRGLDVEAGHDWLGLHFWPSLERSRNEEISYGAQSSGVWRLADKIHCVSCHLEPVQKMKVWFETSVCGWCTAGRSGLQMYSNRCTGRGRGEEAQNFHALSKHNTLPAPRCVYQWRSSWTLLFRGFHGGFIMEAWLIRSLDLQLSSVSSPSPLLRGQGAGLRVPILRWWLGLSGDQLWSYVVSLPFRSHFLVYKRHSSLRWFEGFRNSEPGTRDTIFIFYYITAGNL